MSAAPGLVLSLWGRLPVVVRAILSGSVVALVGTSTWSLLASGNLRFWPSVPWAVVPTGFFLWLFWRYLRGEGWPRSTAEARRASLRANPVAPDAWGIAMFAGMLGYGALFAFIGVWSRLVRLPAESQPITVPPGMPFVTVVMLLLMASVVAGVVEEAAFRGYIQTPIERRHGIAVAILLNGALFGLAHFTHHPAAVLTMLPYYLIVTAIYGGLAWATNSIMPGVVLHALGDVFSLTRLWSTGKPEWQQTSQPPALIWESGPDGAFWFSLTALIILGGAAIWAFVSLAGIARTARHGAELEAAGFNPSKT